jgi:hypothetical protein
MALMNRHLQPMIETIFVMPNEQFSYTSSSLVKQVARYGGQVGHFRPDKRRRGPSECVREMTPGRIAPGRRLPLILGTFLGLAASLQASPVDNAQALFRQGRYGEARAALETLVAADPSNAAACYFLSMTLQRASPPLLDSARPGFPRRSGWPPRTRSTSRNTPASPCCWPTATTRSGSRSMAGTRWQGRRDEPVDLDACEGLMRFCAKAPWPLGERRQGPGPCGRDRTEGSRSGGRRPTGRSPPSLEDRAARSRPFPHRRRPKGSRRRSRSDIATTMPRIPIEDNFTDVLAKAQRGPAFPTASSASGPR